MKDQENQNNKGENFAQLMNVLNTLKDAMRNTSVTSSGNIASQIQQLLTEYGNDPKAKEILSSLLSVAEQRDSKVFKNKTYYVEDQNAQLRAENNQPNIKDLIDQAKLTAFHEEDSRLEEQHKSFKLNIAQYLAARKHENDQRQDLLTSLENNEDIDLKKYASLIKTPEQIKKEYDDRQSLFKHNDEIEKHYNEIVAHKEDLEKEQKKLEQEIKQEEIKPPEAQSPKLAENKKLLQNCLKTHNDLKPVAAKAAIRKQESNAEIEELKKKEKEKERLYARIKSSSSKYKQINPKKAEGLDTLLKALKEEHNALNNDGIIKNPQQHETLLNTFTVLANGKPSSKVELNGTTKLPEQLESHKLNKELKGQTTQIADTMRHKLDTGSITSHNNLPRKRADDLTKSR